jgi:glycerophosphoryl diester phosphodiesterase
MRCLPLAQSSYLPSRPRPLVMAHRGNQVCCPENTLAAFRQAFDDGADVLETDIQVTADGEFLCLHDPTFERTTTGRGRVDATPLAKARTFSAGAGRPGFTAERIPLLAETMALVPPDRALVLELKSDRCCEPAIAHRLAGQIRAGPIPERIAVISFSRARLRSLHRVAPEIPLGFISLTRPWPWRGMHLAGPFWPLLLANPFFVATAHARGQLVCPLDPHPDRRLWIYLALGCDAVLTNDPAATIAALAARLKGRAAEAARRR